MDWEIAASVSSAIAAIVALGISCWQMCLSNKQSLFSRRLNILIITKGLLDLYKSNSELLKQDDQPQSGISYAFQQLANNSFMQEIAPCISHTMEPEYQLRFHLKLDEIRTYSFEARLIFKGRSGPAIAEFLDAYQRQLFAMYQYQISLNHIKKQSDTCSCSPKAADNTVEQISCKRLYSAEIALKTAYEHLATQKMKRKILRQVRLTDTPWDYISRL